MLPVLLNLIRYGHAVNAGLHPGFELVLVPDHFQFQFAKLSAPVLVPERMRKEKRARAVDCRRSHFITRYQISFARLVILKIITRQRVGHFFLLVTLSNRRCVGWSRVTTTTNRKTWGRRPSRWKCPPCSLCWLGSFSSRAHHSFPRPACPTCSPLGTIAPQTHPSPTWISLFRAAGAEASIDPSAEVKLSTARRPSLPPPLRVIFKTNVKTNILFKWFKLGCILGTPSTSSNLLLDFGTEKAGRAGELVWSLTALLSKAAPSSGTPNHQRKEEELSNIKGRKKTKPIWSAKLPSKSSESLSGAPSISAESSGTPSTSSSLWACLFDASCSAWMRRGGNRKEKS